MASYNGVKVFSVTKARDREYLSEDMTRWIRSDPKREIVEKVVVQSSDSEFHCLTIIFFFNETLA